MTNRDEIMALVSSYARAVDDRDVPRIIGCFVDDAHVEFDGGASVVDGVTALAEFFESALVQPRMGTTGTSTHLMSNVTVAFDPSDPDVATVETQAVAFLASDERDTVVIRGLRYSDACLHTEEGWRIARRVHRSLWQCEAPGGVLSATTGQGHG